MQKNINRRESIKGLAMGAAALGTLTASAGTPLSKEALAIDKPLKLKGNINHSVCHWCYGSIPLEEFAEHAKDMGLTAIDILNPNQWAAVEKYGLICSVARDDTFINIPNSFNDPSLHEKLKQGYFNLIDQAVDHGIPNLIVFSGNKRGMDDATGIENCAKGLDPIVEYAEKKKITLVLEMLNSKRSHKDYQFDNTPLAVELAEKVGSERFKLLYDVFHMQIMEGDVIETIKKYNKYFGHYHTGGVPGRNEINGTQELNYPAIMQAIVDTGYKGYVAQEYIPTYEDKIASLREGILICDV